MIGFLEQLQMTSHNFRTSIVGVSLCVACTSRNKIVGVMDVILKKLLSQEV